MLPNRVSTVIRRLCESLESRLSCTIESVNLYGSIALGAYIEGSSDIDFVAIIRRPLTEEDIQAITDVHHELEIALPGTDIMGLYIQRGDLGKDGGDVSACVSYFNKQLRTDGTGADLNPVTWWILQRHGICVYGEAVPFTYEVSADSLVQYVIGNMNSYWAGWIERLAKQTGSVEHAEATGLQARLDEAVEWCVLGMLRQLYTIRERDVISKTAAGSYGLKVLPERWHRLVREAIAIKRGNPISEYALQTERLDDLVELLKHIHAESNRRCESAKNER